MRSINAGNKLANEREKGKNASADGAVALMGAGGRFVISRAGDACQRNSLR